MDFDGFFSFFGHTLETKTGMAEGVAESMAESIAENIALTEAYPKSNLASSKTSDIIPRLIHFAGENKEKGKMY